jgi:hypothetical protein
VKNGASGYLLKEAAGDELVEAVRRVARGELYLGPGIRRSALQQVGEERADPYDRLTTRERQVLQLIAEGMTNRQIAEPPHAADEKTGHPRPDLPGEVRAAARHRLAEVSAVAAGTNRLQTPSDRRRLPALPRGRPRGDPDDTGAASASRGAPVNSAQGESEDAVRRFVDGMTREERMLVVLKRELYEGDWDEMVADLNARLEGRPYIFKLAHRISDDLERIRCLRRFESRHGVDLCEYVPMDV